MCFTVVIPIYNSSSYLEDTLRSIGDSSERTGYEVLLVDDGSNDLQDVNALIDDYPEVRVIVKAKKTNAADSRNIGFSESRYGFVFFLDSDDLLVPGSVDRRIDLHEGNKSGIIFGNFINKSEKKSEATQLDAYSGEDFRDYLFLNKGDVRSSTISVCKHFYKDTLFDSLSFKHQDWIFGIRLFDNNESIMFDSASHAVINVSRVGRMSASMNVPASKYFCDNYLSDLEHFNSFSKRNWLTMIQAKDRVACAFFFSIFVPQSIYDKITLNFYFMASRRPFIGVASLFVGMIRRLKWQ
jgi:glycosyltransferase involved in cell wall biosynthesis